MILAAGLLVLAGLGLFVGGLATGTTSYYWGCVACCALAAVLLIAVRLWPRSRVAAAVEPEKARGAEVRSTSGSGTAAADDVPATPAAPREAVAEPAAPARRGAHEAASDEAPSDEDPGEEDVEVTDLLMVVDLRDQVLVVDEHPRYHLADCRWLRGRPTIPLPVAEARSDGFTPCGVCRPDRSLADLARARKAADKS
ncbi:hypothetical protein [Blastococcus sp. TF02A-26]|uniref:hypothetical protein n=1 Tax=Blastococcus sp. TF02A-26 TaxID=2250577 RepID=UPI000DEA2A36|nr:hypothetical protein [Blastococcus sp. TF02A-26]RBY88392.1 hypothetical protein DQ240_06140 [Blastococcus sp. TF02A-26]